MFHSFRVDQPWFIDGVQCDKTLYPHPFLVGRVIGPVRALRNRARNLEPEADAVVEISIRVPFYVYINRSARITPRDFTKDVNLILSYGERLQCVVVATFAATLAVPECMRQLRHREDTFPMILLTFLLAHFRQKTEVICVLGDCAAMRRVPVR